MTRCRRLVEIGFHIVSGNAESSGVSGSGAKERQQENSDQRGGSPPQTIKAISDNALQAVHVYAQHFDPLSWCHQDGNCQKFYGVFSKSNFR